MHKAPKILISIGDAWVDPYAVIAVDDTLTNDDPGWPNVRVILSTGHIVFGRRQPARVVAAVRHPDREVESDESTETYPDPQHGARSRARRSYGPSNGPRRIWQDTGKGAGDSSP
jgi:hypothetical protein